MPEPIGGFPLAVGASQPSPASYRRLVVRITRMQGWRSASLGTYIWDRGRRCGRNCNSCYDQGWTWTPSVCQDLQDEALDILSCDSQPPLPQRHSFISPPLNSPDRTSPKRASVLYTRNQARQCATKIAKANTKMMIPMVSSRICHNVVPALGALLALGTSGE